MAYDGSVNSQVIRRRIDLLSDTLDECTDNTIAKDCTFVTSQKGKLDEYKRKVTDEDNNNVQEQLPRLKRRLEDIEATYQNRLLEQKRILK